MEAKRKKETDDGVEAIVQKTKRVALENPPLALQTLPYDTIADIVSYLSDEELRALSAAYRESVGWFYREICLPRFLVRHIKGGRNDITHPGDAFAFLEHARTTDGAMAVVIDGQKMMEEELSTLAGWVSRAHHSSVEFTLPLPLDFATLAAVAYGVSVYVKPPSEMEIDTENLRAWAEAMSLGSNPVLRSLHVDRLPAIALGAALNGVSNLHELDIKNVFVPKKREEEARAIFSLANLTALRVLSLSNSRLYFSRDDLMNMSALTSLTLSTSAVDHNENAALKSSVKMLNRAYPFRDSLTHLDMSFWSVFAVSDIFRAFPRLTFLRVSNGRFNRDRSLFVYAPHLKTLTLSRSVMTFRDEEDYMRLPSLTSLNIDHILIEESIPMSIIKLTTLTHLSMVSCSLRSIPSTISWLTNLKTLSFSKNRLASLPANFSKLTSLEALDISYNNLRTISAVVPEDTYVDATEEVFVQLQGDTPDITSNFHRLRVLNLSHNNLVHLPTSIGNMTALTALHIDNNAIIKLPDSFVKLSALRTFDAFLNRLHGLPDDLGKLVNLERLAVDSNKISALPSSLTSLSALQVLNVESNFIRALPNGFGKLSSLRTLQAYHTNIESLPDDFMLLSSLKFVGLPRVLIPNIQPTLRAWVKAKGIQVIFGS